MLVLVLLVGCRTPPIPASVTPREYAVYSAWLSQASESLPADEIVVVRSSTLRLDENSLQYEACLPVRMQGIFSDVPTVTLSELPASHWLNFPDGRSAMLLSPSDPLPPGRPVQLLSFSRVAFTFSGRDAYVWINRARCTAHGDTNDCEGAEGHLYHGKRSGSDWAFIETLCQAASPM